ncbi:MAG TPA: hypothetical protein VNT54_12080 [Solirubrobacteraceae bacterium]|nr:hypothetical protein [Solirubrobacteraceae bacterium]
MREGEASAGGRQRRPRAVLAVLVAVAAAAALALVAVLAPPGAEAPREASAELERCAGLGPGPQARACFGDAISRQIEPAADPTPVLLRVDAAMSRLGSDAASSCHVVMHTVGRRYARKHAITLATLLRYLPRTNDPGCAAGFAHGVVTAIAPAILRDGPRAAHAVCARAATRYQRYSCVHGLGHAYMRFYAEQLAPALKLCDALGADAAPDCAQGAYHDYWLAIAGQDDAERPRGAQTDVRVLCDSQPARFVLPCWYRAFIDTRPAGYQTATPQDLQRVCRETSGVQRRGCITAASVIGSPNPLRQLRVCRGLATRDMLPCIRGTKVQNLDAADLPNQLRVIGRCKAFAAAVRERCYEWLGKVLAVTTDGRFERTGCPRVAQRRACERGARSYERALVTFS